MRIKITKESLLNGLQKVQNVVTSKTTLPILSYVLLNTDQSKIKLSSTDLDMGITCAIPGEITESGAICLPAKKFFEIIREFPFEEIDILTKKNNLTIIKNKTCEFKIMGLGSEEFPKIPEFKENEIIKLDQMVLKKALGMTSFAVSLDETRYILNGILFYFHNRTFNAVATDGRRLSLFEETINQEIKNDVKIIIPLKTIHEVMRNLNLEGEVSLILGKNQIGFEWENLMIISRLVEGDFPDYQQVIPPVSNYKIKINRQIFWGAIRRAALLATPDYQAVKLDVLRNKLIISKSTPDLGEFYEEIETQYEGKEIVIGFNPDYLMDVLKNLDDEVVELEVMESEKPAVIRKPGYIYIVLPIRLG